VFVGVPGAGGEIAEGAGAEGAADGVGAGLMRGTAADEIVGRVDASKMIDPGRDRPSVLALLTVEHARHHD